MSVNIESILFSYSSDNSGNPYAHPASVLCAVEVSIILTFSFSTRLTDSIETALRTAEGITSRCYSCRTHCCRLQPPL